MKLTLRKKPKRHWLEKLSDQAEQEPLLYVLPVLVMAGVALLVEQYWERVAKLD
jgi:hypothetical protein